MEQPSQQLRDSPQTLPTEGIVVAIYAILWLVLLTASLTKKETCQGGIQNLEWTICFQLEEHKQQFFRLKNEIPFHCTFNHHPLFDHTAACSVWRRGRNNDKCCQPYNTNCCQPYNAKYLLSRQQQQPK